MLNSVFGVFAPDTAASVAFEGPVGARDRYTAATVAVALMAVQPLFAPASMNVLARRYRRDSWSAYARGREPIATAGVTVHTGEVRIGRVVVPLETALSWIRDYTN